MKKGIVIGMLALTTVCGVANGETVSQKQARGMAHTFFNAARGQVMQTPSLAWNGRKLTTDRLFTPFYVYNNPAGGFVIISAENKAFPILAYNLTANFDPNNIPPELNTLLKEYARDIEYIRYDSRIPYEAIDAWTNYNTYVAGIIAAPYTATDPVITSEDAEEILDNIANGTYETTTFLYSDIYDPQQWQQLVDEELKSSKSVALGIMQPNGDITPTTVYGKMGDYYKIRLGDKRNDSMYRLMATEYLSQGQLAQLGNASYVEEEIVEEAPFAFYDSFIAEIAAEEATRALELEKSLSILEPQLTNHGSGKYTILLPTEPALARVYNMAGAMVRQHSYRGSNIAAIDLLGEPQGIYVAVVYDRDGYPYSFKLTR